MLRLIKVAEDVLIALDQPLIRYMGMIKNGIMFARLVPNRFLITR
jgi:hypothetical protein